MDNQLKIFLVEIYWLNLFEITEKFNMPTQPAYYCCKKHMVVVEGVARKLYPETNIWEVSRPVLEDWLKNIKSPKSTLILH